MALMNSDGSDGLADLAQRVAALENRILALILILREESPELADELDSLAAQLPSGGELRQEG